VRLLHVASRVDASLDEQNLVSAAGLAAELVDELEVIDARIKAAKKQLAALVAETGSGLLERHRPARCLLRRADPAPALAGRQPADQPGAAHHGAVDGRLLDRRSGLRY
jgi:hypothetical protein